VPVITTASPYELLPQQELVKLVMMLMESNKKLEESNKTLVFEVEKLKHELAQYKQLVHGSKHERFIGSASPEQFTLGLNVEPTHIVEVEQVQKIEAHDRVKTKTVRNYKTTGRQALPAHLPRERVVIQPQIDLTGYKQIGEEITEELNYKEAEFSVTQTVRPKYAEIAKCDDGQSETKADQQEAEEKTNIVIADLPERLIPRCLASDSLLAHIIVSKLVDHLPLDRQLKIFKRSGLELSNSTVGGWVNQVATALVPLGETLRRLIFSGRYVMADETTLKVQDRNKKGKTHQGYLWAYLDPIKRLVVFDYQPGRGREGPLECLKNFKGGYLQTDAYNAYEIFAGREGIRLIHCMAHARRHFFKAKDNDLKRAEYALSKIQELYVLEEEARSKQYTHQQRYELRQQKALDILKELENWMKEEYPKVTPTSPIGKAIHYSLSRWERLKFYATDGQLEIDNNLVENAIRPVALSRKNFLFAGSHRAAQNTALLFALLGTCKLNNVNPKEWLTDVIKKLPSYPVKNLEYLLPHKWKSGCAEAAHRPAHIS
jgi:transposase